MPRRMTLGILEEIRRDLEDIALRMLDHLEFGRANHAQQGVLHQVLRQRAISDTTQKIAEKRRAEARREFIPGRSGGEFVGEWAHLYAIGPLW